VLASSSSLLSYASRERARKGSLPFSPPPAERLSGSFPLLHGAGMQRERGHIPYLSRGRAALSTFFVERETHPHSPPTPIKMASAEE